MDDHALVERARAGDLDAVEALLSRHQGAAYTAALRLLGEPADAEDVAQEALVKAYTRIAELRDGAGFAPWLRRIAINLSLNVLRRRGLLQFESLERPPSGDDSGGERELVDERQRSLEDEVVSRALREEVQGLLRRLPVEQRVAVVLRDMYGYDMAEIADSERCGISAAKMRIARGRAELRRLLGEVPASRPREESRP
jgi:RNA polymerase sigma-70 factor, ECF subfamily